MADFYTANYITAVEIPQAEIVGQFKSESGDPEEFGLLFEKGNPLVSCVNQALSTLRDDGTLDQLEQKWLSGATNVPVLK
jgi:polar amino acid transport system substrate-binding protein